MDPAGWTPHPEAAAAVGAALSTAVRASPRLSSFADVLLRTTSTRLIDWVDHLHIVGPMPAGFEPIGVDGLHRHPGAHLPALAEGGSGVALRVDDVDAFAAIHGGAPMGDPLSGLRAVEAWTDGGVRFGALERRSWTAGTTPATVDDVRAQEALVLWRDRQRGIGGDPGQAIEVARVAATGMVERVGVDLAAAYAMAEERSYWHERNHAAHVQKDRQDKLGLGWGNHDHHTFRASRPFFAGLLEVLRVLGFHKRERFFAGAEAGWGAQVLEQGAAGLVVFADVDLEAAEVDVDFTAGLDRSDSLGTVGLWCALHGESLLAAGMHHLAAQVEHEALVTDLAAVEIGHMNPFSTMPHLWQAFTEAETWLVDRERLARLVSAGHVTRADADRFATVGAPGSHLENLTRADGFKGFNQANVSTTISATDPRSYRPS